VAAENLRNRRLGGLGPSARRRIALVAWGAILVLAAFVVAVLVVVVSRTGCDGGVSSAPCGEPQTVAVLGPPVLAALGVALSAWRRSYVLLVVVVAVAIPFAFLFPALV
jgi:hypothetical protein